MRELTVVGLDLDAKRIILEGPGSSGGAAHNFVLRIDDQLRAAVRGDSARFHQTEIDYGVTNVLSPKEIQSKIRAGASVEQLAASTGADITRIERFAHPVLLERARAAELASAAHPVLADGPAVLTLLESVTTTLVARGLDPEATTWDAWRNEDGRWTVQIAWKAGRSDNVAHFRFAPGAHGGTVNAVDDAASELVDPDFNRALRPLAPVSHFGSGPIEAGPIEADVAEPEATPAPRGRRAKKPAVPGWEDVLLGVRSTGGGQR